MECSCELNNSIKSTLPHLLVVWPSFWCVIFILYARTKSKSDIFCYGPHCQGLAKYLLRIFLSVMFSIFKSVYICHRILSSFSIFIQATEKQALKWIKIQHSFSWAAKQAVFFLENACPSQLANATEIKSKTGYFCYIVNAMTAVNNSDFQTQ